MLGGDEDRLREIVAATPAGIRDAERYAIGKPIEEVRRELGFSAEFPIIKLASNENPLGPSPMAIAAIADKPPELHLYPDGSGFYLRDKIAKKLSVSSNQILLGNGSENILDLICRSFINPGDEVVVSEPSFPQFTLVATLAGGSVKPAPTRKDFSQNANSVLAEITPRTRMVISGVPDNPTGSLLSESEQRRILAALPQKAVLVIDEAYHGLIDDPAYQSSLDGPTPINDGRNPVITSRTFSKAYGLAGLRVAFAAMPAIFCAHVEQARLPFNVNALAQLAAAAALDDDEHVRRTRELVRMEKPLLVAGCKRLGLDVVVGAANFVLVRVHDPAAIDRALLAEGVIIRPLTKPGLSDFIRVSVGRREENERFLTALAEVYKRKRSP